MKIIHLFKSGNIDANELLEYFKKQGIKPSDDFDKMVKKFDKNGDGKINFEEFVACLSEGSIAHIENQYGEKVESM